MRNLGMLAGALAGYTAGAIVIALALAKGPERSRQRPPVLEPGL
jgi:hypothetical protein